MRDTWVWTIADDAHYWGIPPHAWLITVIHLPMPAAGPHASHVGHTGGGGGGGGTPYVMGDTYVPRFWPPFFTLAGSSTIFLGYFFSSTNSKAIFWGTKTTNFYKNRSFWPQIQFFPRSFWVQFSAASGTPPSVFRPSTPPPPPPPPPPPGGHIACIVTDYCLNISKNITFVTIWLNWHLICYIPQICVCSTFDGEYTTITELSQNSRRFELNLPSVQLGTVFLCFN